MREILRITANAIDEAEESFAVVVSGPANLSAEDLHDAINLAGNSLADMADELKARTDLASTPVEGSA